MTSPADIDVVRRFLARARSRVTLLLVMHGVTTGFAVAVMINMVMWLRHGVYVPPGLGSLLFVAFGIGVGTIRGLMHRPRIAAIVEGRAPECRNLLVTASELIARSDTVTPYVSTLVYRDAATLIRSLSFSTILPFRGALTSVAIAAAIWIVAATRPATDAAAAARRAVATATIASISGVDVTVILPAYVGQSRPIQHDPARIDAFIGSRIRLSVRAIAATVTLETLHGKRTLQPDANGSFSAELAADADGFIALEPAMSTGAPGARRLIGISVMPDLPPRVRITTPARDLKLADGKHTIDVAIEADDDLGLATLRLRYTRVSGSGERFSFTEGEVPLAITRNDKRTWHARASWHLDSLALGPGDMVVYRAVATDFRPGAAATESDALIAEVMAPGGVAAAGFALDPEIERYALSEQMVILKTEQLNARKPKMATDSFADAAAEIASEQRRVRAEFVFMMGGEVGTADDPSVDVTTDLNEVAETEASGDLAAARQGRVALVSAIRLMSKADKALTGADLALALTHERAALVQLERTFAHTKIILRALTERERLDLTRRFSGTLTDAARDIRPTAQPPSDARATALRQSLGDLAAIAVASDTGTAMSARIALLAEHILRIDPSALPLQRVSQSLATAATAMQRGRPRDATVLLDSAAIALSAAIRGNLPDAPRVAGSLDASRVAGAMIDALRRPRGTP